MAAKKTSKVWIYSKEFKGEVTLDNFKLIQEDVEELKEGEFLAEAQFLSVDPYQRTLQLKLPINSVILGRQIAK